MRVNMFGTTFRAGTLALAVIGLAGPGIAQTNTNSGTRAPGASDVSAQEIQQQRSLQRQNRTIAPRETTGAASRWAPVEDSESGSKVGQPGAAVPTILPGGPSGAPTNPCTPSLKAQDRC
jgi:hypothetical protein